MRTVAFSEAAQLLDASVAPYRAAPLRLIGMYLLLWVPVQALLLVPTFGRILSETAAAVAFTAYTAALDAAGRSEEPEFRHLAAVLRFTPEKMLALVLTGLVPVVASVLILFGIWGIAETSHFLRQLTQQDGHPSAVMSLDFEAADYVVSMPFTFAAPVWALYRWSGSRSMAANLIACLANWHWVLAMTGFMALAASLLSWLPGQGGLAAALSLLGVTGVSLLSLSWTLAVARRSLPWR